MSACTVQNNLFDILCPYCHHKVGAIFGRMIAGKSVLGCIMCENILILDETLRKPTAKELLEMVNNKLHLVS